MGGLTVYGEVIVIKLGLLQGALLADSAFHVDAPAALLVQWYHFGSAPVIIADFAVSPILCSDAFFRRRPLGSLCLCHLVVPNLACLAEHLNREHVFVGVTKLVPTRAYKIFKSHIGAVRDSSFIRSQGATRFGACTCTAAVTFLEIFFHLEMSIIKLGAPCFFP